MIHQIKSILGCILIMQLLLSCRSRTNVTSEADVQTGTPVTVAGVSKTGLTETIELNATSTFLLKTPVKSVANGYLQDLKIKQGDFVNKGEALMTVITKEARSL